MSQGQQHERLSQTEDNIRRNVRVFMALRGLTGPAVYQALGLSKQTLSHRLTGTSRFTVDEIAQLVPLLAVTFEVLASDPDKLVKSRCSVQVRASDLDFSGAARREEVTGRVLATSAA